MVLKQTNFKELQTYKKGVFGENIVREYLESNGWIVYEPITDKAHAFDKLCIKDKINIVIAEVKTKARMNKFNATGIDVRHYKEYCNIKDKYNIPIFIFFVDEYTKAIYGNKLSELQKEYKAKDGIYPKYIDTRNNKRIILFSLEIMKHIYNLTDNEVEYLKKESSRNYNYNII